MAGGQLESGTVAGRMAQQARRFRMGHAAMAEGMVRPRFAACAGACSGGGVCRHWRRRRGQVRSATTGGGHAARARIGSAEKEIAAPYSHWRRYLVPVLQ